MRGISFLIKPASSLCNMRCSYCFYEDEALNREIASMGIMSEETIDRLLSAAFSSVDPGGVLSFAFQGGEPTVAGLPFFRNFVEKARTKCPPNVRMVFSIQTNGFAVNEAWARFFKQASFLVGLSIDGTASIHDRYRKVGDGSGTWKRVTETLALLLRKGVNVNALCVVTADCAREPEQVYLSFKELGISFMQFIPCMDPMGRERGKEPYSLSSDSYGRFLCRLFDLWYQDWARGQYHSIRMFDDCVHMLLRLPPGTCAARGDCGGCFVVESDGSVYPCDFYVLDDWKMGNLFEYTLEEMAGGRCHTDFLAFGKDKPQECGTCRWHILCNGGCKHDWVRRSGADHNYFCEAFRTFFAYAEAGLLEIARTEQQAMAALSGQRGMPPRR